MNKVEMYKRNIESDRQKFTAYIKKHGYIENLGQAEYRYFRDKINNCGELSYAEKAQLCSDYIEMLNNL